jgi:GTP cyclohydrolase I
MPLVYGKQIVAVYGTAKMIDLQSAQSTLQIYLNQVGVRNLRHPAMVQMQDKSTQPTVATFTMSVGLPADQRGTHMSRFVEMLNYKNWVLSAPCMQELLLLGAERFKTDKVYINATFPLFINKTAPISKVRGMLDYEATLSGVFSTNKNQTHHNTISMGVTVPVTTLCPCSKEISDYGAHNQRSHIKLLITTEENLYFEDLINLIESEASCQIYSVLKRSDEKFVTEYAYNNPRFVEDIVRNIAHKLNANQQFKCSYYKVESENFESIHNHSAYAMLEGPTTATVR